MLDMLPIELLYIIFSKLHNYEITSLLDVCKTFRKTIKTNFFLSYLLTRYHPMVFNSKDRYCDICNIHIYRINDKNKRIIQCNH